MPSGVRQSEDACHEKPPDCEENESPAGPGGDAIGEAIAATLDLCATIRERWWSIRGRDRSDLLPEADQTIPPNLWTSGYRETRQD